MRYAMVIDLDRCIGCRSCSVACRAENLTERGMLWQTVLKQEGGDYPSVWRVFIPRPCMHCTDAECVRVCPTGASYQRSDGVVTVDARKCIGCEYCLLACPYEARSRKRGTSYFDTLTPLEAAARSAERDKGAVPGVVLKCTFCLERLEKGMKPACASACLTNAIYFGDLENPQSEVASALRENVGKVYQLLPIKGIKPNVFYISSRAITGGERMVVLR